MYLVNLILLAVTSGSLAAWYAYKNDLTKGKFIGKTMDMVVSAGMAVMPFVGIVDSQPHFYIYSLSVIGLVIVFVDRYVSPGIRESNRLQYIYHSPDQATFERWTQRDKRYEDGMRLAALLLMGVMGINLILYYFFEQNSLFARVSSIVVVYLVLERGLSLMQTFFAAFPGLWDVVKQTIWMVLYVKTEENAADYERFRPAGIKVFNKVTPPFIFMTSLIFQVLLFAQHLGLFMNR